MFGGMFWASFLSMHSFFPELPHCIVARIQEQTLTEREGEGEGRGREREKENLLEGMSFF